MGVTLGVLPLGVVRRARRGACPSPTCRTRSS
jgi:hypothetical protein